MPPVSQTQEESPPPGRERVELVFNLNAENLDAANQAHFVGNVVAELERNGAIKNRVLLVKIIMGSIRVILEVANEDAERLLEAFQQGKLAYLDVTTVTKPSPPAPPRNNGKYFAAFGYVGIACVLFGIFPVVRYPGCTLGLVLGGLGLVFAYRRKKGWIVPLIATILNAPFSSSPSVGYSARCSRREATHHPRMSQVVTAHRKIIKSLARVRSFNRLTVSSPAFLLVPVAQESWGVSGFEFPGTIKIRGEHGGPEMVLGCWDDPKGGIVTFVANSQKRPSRGFPDLPVPVRESQAGVGNVLSFGWFRPVAGGNRPAQGTGRVERDRE